MTTLRESVITPLIALEATLAVHVVVPNVDEEDYPVVKAWPWLAPEENSRLDTPCFMHGIENERLEMLANEGRRRTGTLHIRMFVGESQPDAHKWSEIAMAFHEEIYGRIQQHTKLETAGVLLRNLRTVGEFPLRFGWPGGDNNPSSIGYIGLHYAVDVQLNDKAPYGAGA